MMSWVLIAVILTFHAGEGGGFGGIADLRAIGIHKSLEGCHKQIDDIMPTANMVGKPMYFKCIPIEFKHQQEVKHEYDLL